MMPGGNATHTIHAVYMKFPYYITQLFATVRKPTQRERELQVKAERVQMMSQELEARYVELEAVKRRIVLLEKKLEVILRKPQTP